MQRGTTLLNSLHPTPRLTGTTLLLSFIIITVGGKGIKILFAGRHFLYLYENHNILFIDFFTLTLALTQRLGVTQKMISWDKVFKLAHNAGWNLHPWDVAG